MANPSHSAPQGPSQSTSQGPSQSISKSKTRGPTTCKKMLKKKKVDEVITVEFDENDKAIGEYGKQFKSYIGTSVRCHVDINISDWHKVEQGLKDTIWDEVKREFNIQNDEKKEIVLKAAGKRWKDFKNRLVREYINKKHPRYASPTELYEYLNDEQWERFVASHTTEEFKEKSKKAREKQLLNEHPHYLGNVGYAGKRPGWLISDPLSSQSSCASISSALTSNDRSLDWVRARSKKGDDGNFYIPNEKTVSVVEKIVEKVEELGQGSFQASRQHDVLSTVLYKKKGDLSGYVRGVGSYLNVRKVFGKPEKARERVSGVVSVDDVREIIKKDLYSDIAEKVRLDITKQVRQDTLLEVQHEIDMLKYQLSLVMKSMPQQFPQQFSNDFRRSAVGTPQSVHMPTEPLLNTRSSCHSVDSYPFGMLQSPIPCRLAVLCDIGDSTTEVVASGTLYPSGPDTMVHSQPLLSLHVKVSVDMLLPSATTTLSIPVPTSFHTTLAEIVGSFAQWPLHLVNIEEEEIIKNSAINKNKGNKQSEEQCDILGLF
ncbi:PREDICTED: uncharacterized protein LOC109159835 [Ipomoea nil]|uniref:uncharacterized protein LOC109159835 n=1 Tax=Ipomoea nil TaxID=35883 RepID=UPI000902000C|nr:PREDICTED: uncharacterized protein LOC109159835 [Ipomoea nil]